MSIHTDFIVLSIKKNLSKDARSKLINNILKSNECIIKMLNEIKLEKDEYEQVINYACKKQNVAFYIINQVEVLDKISYDRLFNSILNSPEYCCEYLKDHFVSGEKREKLLNTIFTSPMYSYWFLLYGDYSQIEREMAFNKILTEPECSLGFIMNCKPNAAEKNAAYKVILTNPETTFHYYEVFNIKGNSPEYLDIFNAIKNNINYAFKFYEKNYFTSESEREILFNTIIKEGYGLIELINLHKPLKINESTTKLNDKEIETIVRKSISSNNKRAARLIHEYIEVPASVADEFDAFMLMLKITDSNKDEGEIWINYA